MITPTNTTVSTKTDYASIKDEYTELFNRMILLPTKQKSVDQQLDRVRKGKTRYEAFATSLGIGIPWYFIALIHCMEADDDVGAFHCHLHNGDSLNERTVHVPAHRPPPSVGDPPFKWEVSAKDALELEGFLKETDWSMAHMLYLMEKYNGFGSRRFHQLATPYLWSFSDLYAHGKYVGDGHWNGNAVSKQMGAAVLLKRGMELGLF